MGNVVDNMIKDGRKYLVYIEVNRAIGIDKCWQVLRWAVPTTLSMYESTQSWVNEDGFAIRLDTCKFVEAYDLDRAIECLRIQPTEDKDKLWVDRALKCEFECSTSELTAYKTNIKDYIIRMFQQSWDNKSKCQKYEIYETLANNGMIHGKRDECGNWYNPSLDAITAEAIIKGCINHMINSMNLKA